MNIPPSKRHSINKVADRKIVIFRSAYPYAKLNLIIFASAYPYAELNLIIFAPAYPYAK